MIFGSHKKLIIRTIYCCGNHYGKSRINCTNNIIILGINYKNSNCNCSSQEILR